MQLLADGLREGAVGMSSGLTYTPGMFASTDELVALCEVLAGAATTRHINAPTERARWRRTARWSRWRAAPDVRCI